MSGSLGACERIALKDLPTLCFSGPLKGCMCAIDPFLDEESERIFIQSPIADEISWRIDGWVVRVLCGDCLAHSG